MSGEHDRPPTVPERTADLSELIGRLADENVEPAERRRLLGRLGLALTRSAHSAGPKAVAGGQWLADTVLQVLPHLTVRDAEALQRHYPGLETDALAAALTRNAARVSAAIGAAGGALAAVEWVAPPALLTTPVQLAAETLAVVAIEIKLVAELHVVYGRAVSGTLADRMTAYAGSWASQRGVDLAAFRPGAGSLVGEATRRRLRDRIARRFGRNLTTLGPLFTGAAIGAALNRRATLKLADKVRADLRVPKIIEGSRVR